MQINLNIKEKNFNYDEVFLERYDSVLRWALQITKYDQELAKDLVQEVYVQFTVTRRDPAMVNSIDNYLYVALRNAYISYLRRTIRSRPKQLSIIDYELVDNALLAVDPRQQMRVHDNLRAVCRYACLRKSSSISGSILILRFFHGYFPSEIARISNSSRNAVEARLLSARREAIAYLADPNSLARSTVNFAGGQSAKNYVQHYHGVLNDLRNEILGARQGDCYHIEQIQNFYQAAKTGITCSALSHLVSCTNCLDKTNELLGLPLLRDRHPLDTLGKESAAPQPEKEIQTSEIKSMSLAANHR